MTDWLPLYPVYLVDVAGASVMIILAPLALSYAGALRRLEPRNVLWTYLFWLAVALAAFTVSRAMGHILKFLVIAGGHGKIWSSLSPYSGGLNTLTITFAGVLTFYYANVREIIERTQKEHKQLEGAHRALRRLNLQLEERVSNRTRALSLSEQKFRGFFENSGDAIFFCDAEGRLTDINDSGVELFGFKHKHEILGLFIHHFFVNPQKWEKCRRRLVENGVVKDFEVIFCRPDGTRLSLMIAISAMKDDIGGIRGCEAIAKDLTHLKRVNEQLIHSEKMASIGQMAAGIVHEVNNPLGVILGYSQLLMEEHKDHEEMAATLAVIENQTQVCRRIIGDLLRFARRPQKESLTPLDVNRCVGEVGSLMEHSLLMDRITLRQTLGDGLPPILGDAEKLHQVLVNMIGNARHAVGENGLIALHTRLRPMTGQVEIIIGDTGHGIAPEVMPHIFDPFFTTKPVDQGTGLGLSVSHGIIRDQGGQIEVYSPPAEARFREDGLKTTFHLLLPTVKGGNAAEGEAAA